MLPLKRLDQVQNRHDLLTCIYDGLQLIIDKLRHGKSVLDIIPQCNSFLTGTFNHLHPHPELILSCVGHGYLDVLDGSHALNPNKLIVTPRGVAHFERAKYADKTYANIIIGCSNTRMSSHIRITRPGQKTNVTSHRIVVDDNRMHRISRYFNEACTAHGEQVHKPHAVSIGLCLAACATLSDLVSDALSEKDGKEDAQEHLIQMTRAYIEQHLAKPDLRISDVALAIGCSADYLSHRFHQLTKQHLSRWITEQRLSFSCTLLRDSNLGIEEVARAVGFQDPGYFSRCFRKLHGVSPRDWRKSL